MQKPEILYRGIHLSYDELKNFNFDDDLVVPYQPIINENGQETVLDGNEYGVYMTDNLQMVKDVYGNAHGPGTNLYPNFNFNGHQIAIADVGIVYEINTDNLDIHKPRITSLLSSVYNNGFKGDEWITQSPIPFNNFRILRIIIGEDVLHDRQEIKITDDLGRLKEEIIKILDERKFRLQLLAQELFKLPRFRLNMINSDDINLYRDIFGAGGYKYLKASQIDLTDFHGILKYISYKIYQNNPDTIDYSTLNYLKRLERNLSKVKEDEKLDMFNELIKHDLEQISRKKEELLSNSNNKQIDTLHFDNRKMALEKILSYLDEVYKTQMANDRKVY